MMFYFHRPPRNNKKKKKKRRKKGTNTTVSAERRTRKYELSINTTRLAGSPPVLMTGWIVDGTRYWINKQL